VSYLTRDNANHDIDGYTDHHQFVLAEAQAIYRYLARKMDILGKTDHEMALVEQFCFSWEELHEKYWPLLYGWKNLLTPEQYDETLQKVLHEQIKPIVMKHEEALAKNGTGFYVGDNVISILLNLYSHLSKSFTTSL
jgi:glutathione S-transferase